MTPPDPGQGAGRAQIAFVGAGGFISAFHLLTARDSDAMEIRTIADLDESILEKHSSRLAVGYTTTDYERVLADPEVDIVIIGTKQDLHSRIIIESLDAGKWVHCEKPMAETREEGAAVIAAEDRNPGRLSIGFNRRFAPAYAEAKRLMQSTGRPWFIDYRLMAPNLNKEKATREYYAKRERILYEGTHILDLMYWLLEAAPQRVFMTGDRCFNNCCLLEYADGSRVSFLCGSMGSHCFGKEHMDLFAEYTTISIDEFVDMKVRGFKGEYDRVFPPYLGEHAEAVRRYGLDFYETYKVDRMLRDRSLVDFCDEMKVVIEEVRRPTEQAFDAADYSPVHPDLWSFSPDKGWVQSIEHFVQCYLTGETPQNADARAGAISTDLALALLQSLESGQPVGFSV